MTKLDINDVRFREKPIQALTREELIEALMQALNQLHRREGYSAVGGITMLNGRFAPPA